MSTRKRRDRRFARIGREIGELVERKNAAYGSSFAKAGAALRILYPAGLTAAQMDDALLLARIWDKMQRIATDRDALGESPYRDIAGYGILGAALHENKTNPEDDGDAAQMSTVGVRPSDQGEDAQVLQRGVPAQAGGGRKAGAPQHVRAAQVPDLPPQLQWSDRWKAEAAEVKTHIASKRWRETTEVM